MEGTPPVHSGSGYGTHTRELYPCSIKSKDFSGHDVTIDNNIKPLTYDHDIDAPCGNSQSISRQPSVPERKVSTLPKQMVLKQPKTVGLTFRSGSTYSFSSFRPSFRSSFTRARSATQGTRHYEESRRQYNQLEASRFYGLDVEKHAGIGISLVWIKFNLDFKDEACILSALNSSIAVQQAIEIDQEVIQRINPTFELNNPRAPAPCYNIDILFAYINTSGWFSL
ncbi:hypothetical protein NX722_09100 [Endozoicomonas gorgoniicola]|uniref:Uncharacterized protein n=1 Tax=Endozoicomonas gorgoniicola TaxID=1234144 RepID=A0ABT3MTW0_9GAMM|nr:hypothetical protein [Endozoicomonas gorgoniicola]MCW7552797.1 hypothetical protein [Endozoicomonas gorgoniicola]